MWDLGHIAHFEELWLVRNLDGPVEFGEMPGIYNPFEHPRRVRGELQLPSLDECRRLMGEIRSRVLAAYVARSNSTSDNPLLRDGYVYSMVLQHEYQHNETILQTLQLKQGMPYRAPRDVRACQRRATVACDGRWCVSPAVAFGSGRTIARRPTTTSVRAHEREVAPFSIDVFPVTNGDFLEFMRDGGYSRSELWSEAGWEWLAEAKVDAPKYWMRDGDDWCVRVMDDVRSVDPELPVCHVSYHEAEAFARFAGKRLPTEQEWEVAAGWDRVDAAHARVPVGR